MKRLVYGSLFVWMALLFVVPAQARNHEEDPKFSLHGEVRTRWEYVSNYLDVQDHDDASLDDDFDFWSYRVRIAARGEFGDNVWGHVELQNFGFFGNDDPLESFQDPLNQASRLSFDDSEVDLYQGYVELRKLWGSDWSIRLGRQEHTLGHELHLGDADFYNGLTFDGVRAMADFDRFDANLFYYVTSEDSSAAGYSNPFTLATGVSFIDAFGDDDVNLSGLTVNVEIGDGGQSIEPYLLMARDGSYSLGGGGGKILTLGALYGRSVESRDDLHDSPFDWSAEMAIQRGDYEPNGADMDISSSILEGWFGYNWAHGGKARSRVHVGALVASGDDDPLDDDIESFIPLFPDTHAFNRLGDLDLFGGANAVSLHTAGLPLGTGNLGLTNVTDINMGYEWWSRKNTHHFAVSLHNLSLTEEKQLGPVLTALTGGPVAITESDIGMEINLGYDYAYSDRVRFRAGLASLSAGDVLDEVSLLVNSGKADDVMRVWWQVGLNW